MLEIGKLLTSHMNRPMGVDWNPYFSWVLQSDETCVRQASYELVVTDEQGNVVWDSSVRESDQATFVPYEGSPLQALTTYCWQVKVTDNHGQTACAESSFETGYLDASAWRASWVKSPFGEGERGAHLGEQPSAVYFRRQFTLGEGVQKARLYATAHGCYELEVNGRAASDRKLAPESASYQGYLPYQAYDVTSLVHEGANELRFLVGDGWYHGFMTKYPGADYDPAYGIIFQLELWLSDGTRQNICSDGAVEVSQSPVLCSDLFAGERYDANLEGEGCRAWKPCALADWSKDALAAQYGEPVKEVVELPVKELLTSPNGERILDFGQVIAGYVRFRVNEPRGTAITITCTEGLDEQGNFFDNNPTADQRIEYVSNGEESVFSPHFTYQGFRYICVDGVSELRPEDYTAVAISSVKDPAGSFACSDEDVNRLYQNTLWSQRANMISVPTDCPQREKAGWLGDIEVYTRTALLNEDITSFLTRWLRSVRIEQKPNGAAPMVAPLAGAYLGQYEMQKQQAGTTDDVSPAGWGDAVVLVPWYMYEITGNKLILAEQYDAMKRWCDYQLREAHDKRNPESTLPDEVEGYLWDTGYHYGEHLIPSYSRNGYGPETFEAIRQSTKYVAPIYSYYSLSTLVKVIELLADDAEGERKAQLEADLAHYAPLTDKVKGAIQAGVIGEDGAMPADLMGAYAMPLYFGLVPEGLRERFQERLVGHIAANGGCLDTGFLGTWLLQDTLCGMGRPDLAYDLLFQTQAPSWLFEVQHGATTIWESWFALDETGKPFVSQMGEYTFTMSLNHYAFGAVDDWMFRTINGIQSEGAGYRRIRIAPVMDERLSWAKRSFESEHGRIVSDWRREGDTFALHVEIPCNTEATVVLPDGREERVGSGSYDFEATCR